jgi:hypothetical protein
LRELKVLVDRIWPTVDDLIARNKLVIVLPNSIESIQAVSLE